MGKKLSLLFLCLFAVIGSTLAQITVKGLVLSSEDNEPIIGASVKLVGSEVGVITNAEGKFTLNVDNKNAHLEISYIGMTTKKVKASEKLKVFLTPDSKQIDELLVVAYGKQKKESFTGSAGVVDNKTLDKRVVADVSNALAGTVSGVQIYNNASGAPGNGVRIRIRGIGSMSSSNAPLIILDGVPYDGNLSMINPNDVASMTVLKDAAANAIYGSRGANGVILITTKAGKSEEAVVSLDAKWGSNSRLVPQYDVITDPAQYVQTQFKSMYNGVIYAKGTPEEAYASANKNLWDKANGGLGYQIFTMPQGENFILPNLTINPNAKLGYSDGKFFYTPDNYYDEAFKNSFRQEYNISISGKSNKLQYYASAGYLDDNGITAKSFFKRYSTRINANYQAKKWLRVGTNLYYANTNNKALSGQNSSSGKNAAGNAFYLANNIAPIYPLYVRNADGSIMINKATGHYVYDNGANTNFSRPNFSGNAIRDIYYNNANQDRDQLTTKLYAQITPIKNLMLTANISANYEGIRTNQLDSPFGSGISSDGAVSVNSFRNLGINNQYLAQYSISLGKHNLDALVGYEQYKFTTKFLYGTNNHLYSPFIGELDNAVSPPVTRPSSSVDKYMSEGVLSRIQYDYNGKYFASASFRRDASSVFAKENRWGSFGSVGGAWLITKEDFMKDIRFLNLLKLKVSWGKQGNDALINPVTGNRQYYAYQDFYSPSYSDGQYSLVMTYKGNKELTWETSYAFNTGLDFALLNNRISGNVEFFSRKTIDLIYNKPIPPSLGIVTGSIPTNIGSILNSGIELNLNATIIKTNDLEWNVNFNLTHYKNKILALSPELEKDGLKGSSSIRRIGGSLFQSYLKVSMVDHTDGKMKYYKDPDHNIYELTENPDLAVQSDLGDIMPKAYGGFGTNLTYKGLDFTAMFSYQLGGKIYDRQYQVYMHNGTGAFTGTNWHKDILKAWTPNNKLSNIPRLNMNELRHISEFNSYFLISSNYLSINNITIGYTIPKQWLHKIGLTKCRLYFSADNLAVFSKRKGLDPRYSYGTSGSDGSTSDYPAMRTLTAGLQVSF